MAFGDPAILVCAYEDPKKCQERSIAGAISLQKHKQRLPFLRKQHEIVFYCA